MSKLEFDVSAVRLNAHASEARCKEATITLDTDLARDFGPVRPFINIVEAEARHISALLALFAKYAVSPPPNSWRDRAPRFASAHEACVAGVQGEIDNVATYDRLLPVTQRPDILEVFRALRSASQDRHLPAFQRCAQRG